jgi:hypothetical protein
MFHIKYADLDRVDRSFAREMMLRISNVALEFTSAPSIADAAPTIARTLSPLCKEGRLRKVIIKGVFREWKLDPVSNVYHRQDLVASLSSLMNFETVGQNVSVQRGKETPSERRSRFFSEWYALSDLLR